MGKMKQFCSLLLLLIFASQGSGQQADNTAAVNRYILQYKDVAVREMMEYHIPASITLAQGILESNAGRSPLAVEANNHFGIKCHKEWTGKKFYKDDDAKSECFRKYDNPLESFHDHSWFLKSRDRYKGLFSLDISDYKGWANGLKAAGYATNPSYSQILIKTIVTYSLDRYDKVVIAEAAGESVDDLENPGKQEWLRRFKLLSNGPANRNIFQNNNLKMIIARQDDNLYVIARDFNTSVGKLLAYNDLPFATAFKPGQIVYLEHKRRKAAVKNHKVQMDESLYSISQLYGVKLRLLYKKNHLDKGSEPKKGTILRLR